METVGFLLLLIPDAFMLSADSKTLFAYLYDEYGIARKPENSHSSHRNSFRLRERATQTPRLWERATQTPRSWERAAQTPHSKKDRTLTAAQPRNKSHGGTQ